MKMLIRLLPILAWGALGYADCTFPQLVVSRDSTGKMLSVSPTLDQCVNIPVSITLNVYNQASIIKLTSADITYVSGPLSISVNGGTVRAGTLVASAGLTGQSGAKALLFTAEGDYTFRASGNNGPTTTPQNFVVRISHFQITPTAVNVATGGNAPSSNVFTASTAISGQLAIKLGTFTNNAGGESLANLTFSTADTQHVSVTASPQNSSGVFGVGGSLSIFAASGPNFVVVPPQLLVQAIIGEAQNQAQNAQLAVAVVIRNRIGSTLSFGESRKTYNAEVNAPRQFTSVSAASFQKAAYRATAQSTTAYDAALLNASTVFGQNYNVTLGGAIAYGSPNVLGKSTARFASDMAQLQNAITTCPKTPAKNLNFSNVWYGGFWFDDQALVVDGIDPANFVFFRKRAPGDCAVIKISFN